MNAGDWFGGICALLLLLSLFAVPCWAFWALMDAFPRQERKAEGGSSDESH